MFKLDKEDLKVCELFSLLNKEKTRLGILDWGVKMTTLEDGKLKWTINHRVDLSCRCSLLHYAIIVSFTVFLKIVKSHSDHRTQTGRSFLPTWVPFSGYCMSKDSQE